MEGFAEAMLDAIRLRHAEMRRSVGSVDLMFVGFIQFFPICLRIKMSAMGKKYSIQKDSKVFVPLCLPAMYIDQGLAMLQAIGVRLARHIFLTRAIGAEEVKAIVQGVWKSFEIFQGFAPGETALQGMIFGGSSGTVACHFSGTW